MYKRKYYYNSDCFLKKSFGLVEYKLDHYGQIYVYMIIKTNPKTK